MSAQSILSNSFYNNKYIEKFITLIRDTTGFSHNASTTTAGVAVAATILFAWQQIRSTRKKSALASIPVPKGALPVVGMYAIILTTFFLISFYSITNLFPFYNLFLLHIKKGHLPLLGTDLAATFHEWHKELGI